jgi:hypothetical protein
MADLEVYHQPTEFTVSCLPPDHRDRHYLEVTVGYRGGDRWAVLDGRQCLGSDGEWDWESIPSERTDEWLATHRFDLETALGLAAQHAPKLTVNGLSVADVLERSGRSGE